MNSIDWLARHALYSPDHTALVETETGDRMSYLDLNGSACRAAGFLKSHGIRQGDRVAVLSFNCAEMLYTLFACQKLGAIFLPLNYKLPLAELGPILAEAEPSVLLFHPEFLDTAQQINVPSVELRRIVDHPPHRTFHPVSWDEPQMILYTSGTTGKPKGAILSHRMNLWNAINSAVRELVPSDIALVHSPMFSTGGLNVATLPTFFLGGKLVLMKRWDVDEVFDVIEKERITVMFAVPTQFLMMAESPRWKEARLSTLRNVMSGGAPMPQTVLERILDRGLPYKQGYGMTEVGANCFSLDPRDARRKQGSIGLPNFSIDARIVDDEGVEVEAGTVGELLLSTPAMIDGYWNDAAAAAAAIREGWFHTGDLARRDEEGYYYIVGRKKDMFISGGENVYPAEIENLLQEHPKIAQVAAVGIPDPVLGEAGMVAVVLKPGEVLSQEDTLFFLRSQLAKYKLPKTVLFLPELPRNAQGKTDKKELRRMGTPA